MNKNNENIIIEFISEMTENEIHYIAGEKEKEVLNGKVLILKKENKYIPIKVLDRKDGLVVLLNLFKMFYLISLGKSRSAMSESIFSENLLNDISFYRIDKPDKPDIRRKYLNFLKKHREEMFLIEHSKKQKYDAAINKTFFVVSNGCDLTENMKNAKNNLEEIRLKNNEKYNYFLESGAFHRANLLYRLKFVENEESVLFYEFLKKNNEKFTNMTPEEFGMTDSQIIDGLSSSGQVIESLLFFAYLKQSMNFKEMLLVSIAYPKKDVETKLKILKYIKKII